MKRNLQRIAFMRFSSSSRIPFVFGWVALQFLSSSLLNKSVVSLFARSAGVLPQSEAVKDSHDTPGRITFRDGTVGMPNMTPSMNKNV